MHVAQVLMLKTDSGPDRKNTYASAQLAYTPLAIALKLDLLVLMRTAPGQSFVNPVERVMSVLSLGIHGLATERATCPANTEAVLKGANSMKAVRTALANVDVEQAAAPDSHTSRFAASMQAPIAIVRSALEVRFARCFQAVVQLGGCLLGGFALPSSHMRCSMLICLSDAEHAVERQASFLDGPCHER